MNRNIIITLAIVAAFALGLSVNAPDVEMPFTASEEGPAAEDRKPDKPVRQGYVGQRLDQMQAPDRIGKVIKAMTRRESSHPDKWRRLSQVQQVLDQELKVIQCSETNSFTVGQCDCWVYGRCEDAMHKGERLIDCRDSHKWNDCACWIDDKSYGDTLCRMMERRDRCDQFAVPELRYECRKRWTDKRIPKRLGWDEDGDE